MYILIGSSSSAAPSESTAAAAAVSVKHYGTYYIREGGMSGVPNELWKQLTSLLGDDTDDVIGEEQQLEDDEEDAEGKSDDGSAVEIGVEECCMLKDCLQRKLDSLKSTEERYADIA